MKILIFLIVCSAVLISGCIQECPECRECPEPNCPDFVVNRTTITIPGYVSQDIIFFYNHSEAFQKCVNANYRGDECFGFHYPMCEKEFQKQLNIIPDHCEVVFDFGDMEVTAGNVGCRCWYESPVSS